LEQQANSGSVWHFQDTDQDKKVSDVQEEAKDET
jgi:hypothetical protein